MGGGCLKVVVGGILAVLFLAFIGGMAGNDRADDAAVSPSPSIKQKGFFQDDRRNRVFTLEVPAGTAYGQVRAFAQTLPYTQGQVTSAYFYRQGANMPVDGVTLAPTFLAATGVVDTPGLARYSFVSIRGFNGQEAFADCEATPDEDLCVPSPG